MINQARASKLFEIVTGIPLAITNATNLTANLGITDYSMA